MSILTCILACPFVAALALAFVPGSYRVVHRGVAILATLLSGLLAAKMFLQFQVGTAGYQFQQQVSWVTSLGISYHVGVDGINVGLVLMGAIVACAAACVGIFSRMLMRIHCCALARSRCGAESCRTPPLFFGTWKVT